MQLSPIYGTEPVIDLDEAPGAVLVPLARQRRRLVAALLALTPEQLAGAPTRCEGWTPRDLASHLDTADGFWAWSARSGLAGEPTTLLAGFDPVASPAQMAADDARTGPQVVEALAATTDGLLAALAAADDDGWRCLAEGPPGHLSLTALAHHALWDGWVHERDLLLPAGEEPPVEPDEVLGALRYAAALAPGYGLTVGEARRGTMAVVPTGTGIGADDAFTVEIGDQVRVRAGRGADADLVLEGDAVALVESLSARGPALDVDPAHAWMIGSLRVVFDQA